MLLKGFGFSGYRSISSEFIRIYPLKKINFIIGKNNSGKSNIINFLTQHAPQCVQLINKRSREGIALPYLDTPQTTQSPLRIGFPIDKKNADEFLNRVSHSGSQQENKKAILSKLMASPNFLPINGTPWYVYEHSNTRSKEFTLKADLQRTKTILQPWEWEILWKSINNMSGGDVNTWVHDVVHALSPATKLPHIELIPAIRRIGDSGTTPSDFSGTGIIERLARIQNPDFSNQQEKEKFHAINDFLKKVLDNASAQLEIPYERDMIVVHMDGKSLPLSSLGTGIHEVVILAAAATLLNNSVICIEEPELHLHPILQRKLVKYLMEETQNQYLFTTHSAHLLDTVEAEIFHVTHDGVDTKVSAVASTKQKFDVCHDLGYKASDILQANCIIWVEGPSDRIYLNYWIKALNPDLIEGTHYSIMFFGGRLFSHLSALDTEDINQRAADLISIRKLNRNSVIVFDSDKPGPHAKINETKKRLRDEFNTGPGFAWITKGREIENYLDYDNLEDSVKAVHPRANGIKNKSDWSNLLLYKNNHGKDTVANKVPVARHYTTHYPAHFDRLDLKKQINEVIRVIKQANQGVD